MEDNELEDGEAACNLDLIKFLQTIQDKWLYAILRIGPFVVENGNIESDVNISAVIEKQGMDGLIELSSKFSNDSSVLQEIMSIISIRCLRAPKYATHASKSEAIVLVIQAIESFPDLDQLQRNSFS
ncbi:Armadillo repeat-containing protein [Forsythia ovata]|uniref:Armadillo repeat-containing protein n=1 Tax=Forsythia ovata TaxID=205694 RepID=A0ABD1P4W8_9LAMI